jgi:uncharacterized protein
MFDDELLVKAGCSPEVVAHCKMVSKIALSIADRLSITVDRELVRQGGLFHDIGRSKAHGITHALVGVEIARNLGFSNELVAIIERHIGAGITDVEAVRLGLPKKNYLPLTPEEKIVSYADNLTSGVHQMPFSEALERFLNLLGPTHAGIGRFIKQHDEIQGWMRSRP